jgi:hypothetical protein
VKGKRKRTSGNIEKKAKKMNSKRRETLNHNDVEESEDGDDDDDDDDGEEEEEEDDVEDGVGDSSENACTKFSFSETRDTNRRQKLDIPINSVYV